MPRPVDNATSYLPGLDGVRALAVALVICFHLGLASFSGGLLGVGIFFTLSGFLITSLLVGGRERRGDWGLRTFWLRRARRLLPAVVIVLVTCMVVVALVDSADLKRRSIEALAALGYVANWHTIFAGDSYFTEINGAGPFDHLWSLSVEEQYYLVWPLLLAALVWSFRRRLRLVAAATLVLAAGSYVLLALLAHPGMDNTRVYEGTDTRSGSLLLGACLALVWHSKGGRIGVETQWGRRYRFVWDALGVLGLAGIGWLVTNTTENSFSLYRWGLLLLSVSTLGLLIAVAHPATLLAKAFGVLPLRWLGERSYGIYLWHLPLIAFTPTDLLATHPVVRDLLQVALTVLLAALSWRFVESPIRTLGFCGAFGAARQAAADRLSAATQRRPGMVVGTSLVMSVAIAAMLLPRALPRGQNSDIRAMPPPPPPRVPSTAPQRPVMPTTQLPEQPTSPPPASSTSVPAAKPGSTRCRSVIEVGDSTSEGLYGAESVLTPAQNLKGQLRDVGVRSFTAEISGARSIIERYENQPSGEDVVQAHVRAGYRGCWIIALGNVDAATVAEYAPNTASIAERIRTIMHTIPRGSPVLWLTTRTLRTDGVFRESVYPPWNQGLVAACGTYPNMRVYDWASAYQTSWFGPDGIHATTTGYRHKAHLIAQALALAFPTSGASSSCLVSTDR